MKHRILGPLLAASLGVLAVAVALPHPPSTTQRTEAAPRAGPARIAGRNGLSVPALVAMKTAGDGLGYDVPALLTDGYFARLRASGVELVRLVTRPLPLLTGSAQARSAARAQLLATVRRLQAAGMTVIVDPHPWSPDTKADELAILCDPARRAEHRAMLLALADALAPLPRARTLLELLNEPRPCRIDGRIVWPAVQRDWVAAIRARHRQLPLLVTGTWEGPDTLQIDPTPYRGDPNILFSWHFYDPFVFTHQEAYFHARGVPFPAPGTIVAGMQRFAAIDRSAMSWSDANNLRKYLTGDGGGAAIDATFAGVVAWARRNGIAPNRIVIGEYGVPLTRDPRNAATRDDELRWLSAVAAASRRAGFRRVFWVLPIRPNMDHDAATGFLRADVAEAIGLRPFSRPAPASGGGER